MANVKWYLADLVIEIQIEDDPRNVVHINTVLVRAESPEEAYSKALALGGQQESTDINTEHKIVKFIFRGLAELEVISNELEHGTEILYSEKIDVPEEQIDKMLSKKEELSVFMPNINQIPINKPNYAPGDIMRELTKRLEGEG